MKKIIFFFLFFCSSFTYAMKTNVVFFNPFPDGKLDTAYSVEKTIEGKCYSSTVTASDGAWRCEDASQKIYDPCFSSNKGDRNTLACLPSPWDTSVVEVKTELPYIRVYKQAQYKNYQPWAIELSNHVKCSLISGASTEINHENASYTCDKDTFIIGQVQTDQDPWVAQWQHGYFTDWMNIATAWY